MQFTEYEISPELKLEVKKKALKYPFKTLKPGKSFYVDCSEVNELSFRALVSAANGKLEDNLKCFKHKKLNKDGTIKAEFLEVGNIGSKKLGKTEAVYDCEIFELSPMMKEYLETGSIKYTYPFEKLTEGMCFIVPLGQTTEGSLRVTCIAKSKIYGKKFIVLKHDEPYNCFEVACIKFKEKVAYPVTEMSNNAIVREAGYANEA